MSKFVITRRDTLAAAAAAAAMVALSPGRARAEHTTAHQEDYMPLLRIDLYEGRSDDELAKLLDTVHAVMLSAFKVPARDRYQIVSEHRPSRMIMEDTGLDIPRTKNFVMIQVTTRPRTREMKEQFYRDMAAGLEKTCGVAPSDVMMNFVTCADEDWSFGYGRAQFLTKEL
jgi:phenylpyruvate tautomerase PptA (4-oxalocrotonate tautomerase family)